MELKKYAVIVGDNPTDLQNVLTALNKAGFLILGDPAKRGEENWRVVTINECCQGQVGWMSTRHTDRLVYHKNGAMEILFPEYVIENANKLYEATYSSPAPKPVEMTMTEVCEALGKQIKIIEG